MRMSMRPCAGLTPRDQYYSGTENTKVHACVPYRQDGARRPDFYGRHFYSECVIVLVGQKVVRETRVLVPR